LMTLLQERDAARRRRRLEVREETRRRLRAALAELVPGAKVIIFGSLAKAGAFNDRSDIDLALEACQKATARFDRQEEKPASEFRVLRVFCGQKLGREYKKAPADHADHSEARRVKPHRARSPRFLHPSLRRSASSAGKKSLLCPFVVKNSQYSQQSQWSICPPVPSHAKPLAYECGTTPGN